MKSSCGCRLAWCLSVASFAWTGGAVAQTPASSSAPLQLQMPQQRIEAAPAADPSDNAKVDAQDSAASADVGTSGAQVHGSVSAGIGYSKGFGTSRYGAADLDVSGTSDGGRQYDVQIHLMQGDGPGFIPYGVYGVPRYRGE